jgi:hypothetical protein
MSLADIASDGRVLLTRESRRLELVLAGADRPPVDITWYDWSRVQEISADGAYVLFDESGDGAAGRTATFLYRVADSEVVRIGEGRAMGLSSGNDAALLLDDKDRTLVRLAPIGPGKPRELPRSGLTYPWVRFLPGDRELLAQASEPGKGLRLYRVPVGGGPPAAVTGHTVVRNVAVSPEGAHVALLDAERRLMIYPLGRRGIPANPHARTVGSRPVAGRRTGGAACGVLHRGARAGLAVASSQPTASPMGYRRAGRRDRGQRGDARGANGNTSPTGRMEAI